MKASSSPLGSLRDRNRSAQRERILDAARSLFASRGFDAVTMGEVAELAGVVRATVFNHFGSKHALVEAITAGVFDYYAVMLDQALADEGSATSALVRALFEHMGAGIEQFHGFYREVFREIMKIQVGLEEGSTAARAAERTQERLTRLLARGQQRGELSRDFSAGDLETAFSSLANGTIDRWLYDDASGSLRERMRKAAEIFLGPVASAASLAEPPAPLAFSIDPIPGPIRLPRARTRTTK
jgi:AcrR family transcriptional regulator